jgi:uncharacterized membrane-anchored protein YjiN (DUF445 family)
MENIENYKYQKLRKMKMIATGILLLMIFILVISKFLMEFSPIFSYVFAFSEAAVIGALADWFAVVALFKHPLGMKFIPHTAIIPKNKSSIAQSLGSFVKDNFLTRENIKSRINISFSKAVSSYLDKNSEMAAYFISNKILPMVINAIEEMNLINNIAESTIKSLKNIKITPIIGDILDHIISDVRYTGLIKDFLSVLKEFLQKDKEQVKLLIQNELPSALALMPALSGILSDKILIAIDNFLSKKIEDENEGTQDYNKVMENGLKNFVIKLKSSEEYIEKGEEIKQKLLSSPEILIYLNKSWMDIKNLVLEDTNKENSKTKEKLVVLIGETTKLLESKPAQENIDNWLLEFLLDYIENNKEKVASFIEDTINNWDEKEVSEKLELQVGSDLQYIRLNGTIVGGLAGLLLKILFDLGTVISFAAIFKA